MREWLRPNAVRPSPGSVVERWMSSRSRHADTFDCGVRVVGGTVAREGRRWSFRLSAVDPLALDGVITLQHGAKATLRLALDDVAPDELPPDATRPGHVIVAATERSSGARVQVSVGMGHLGRFGIDAPL